MLGSKLELERPQVGPWIDIDLMLVLVAQDHTACLLFTSRAGHYRYHSSVGMSHEASVTCAIEHFRWSGEVRTVQSKSTPVPHQSGFLFFLIFVLFHFDQAKRSPLFDRDNPILGLERCGWICSHSWRFPRKRPFHFQTGMALHSFAIRNKPQQNRSANRDREG